MILEIADIRIQPGRQADFERAVKQGFDVVFPQAKGFLGHEVRHGIESPERYVLLLHWATLEDHTVAFRGSPLYAQWRGLVGEFFAQPPLVEHFDLIGRSGAPDGTAR
ncbi:Antibiotic biosynthesis monooxygenase [Leptothrix cholodnii SP-6]|uniref:Antibiotic biosynthesis monooxygenase n=1 Tax=Leptothrix cholodnii (strain ATCC 51168 / LMG 8142 / SP-6) TaxID=395495 RepID=B1Y1C1_LEPCP|nr:antibiotic biosynthesis monooxygenase [Leptothrix cholodnii]ACB33098.1 Antibiotic biosynthesis monooxygenase [Leptothrix cholodnii SP-6]